MMWWWAVALAASPADVVAMGSTVDGRAVAVVVSDGGIDRVVPARKARRHIGADTVVVSADRVTPGFVDAHGHVGWLASIRSQVDLTGAATYAEALRRIGGADPGVAVVRGHGWDQNDWPDVPEGGWPLGRDLAAATGGRPAVLSRIDGHATWVSPDLLVDLPQADPEGGTVIRDATGQPTGVLVDAASSLVSLPDAPPSMAALEATVDALSRAGLTGVHAMSVDADELQRLATLDATHRLPLRVWAYLRAGEPVPPPAARAGSLLTVMGVKRFADGALGSRGAWLHDDYADAPGQRGLPQDALARLAADARADREAGLSTAVHAIGDAAVDATLDALCAATEAVPAGPPPRVEHAQVLSPEAISRFAACGVVASMQPTHATSDSPWAGARLGPERLTRAYAWRTLADAGATLAFGSDFPVEAYDPWGGLAAASTRRPEGKREGWRVEESVSLREAMQAFSAGTWGALGREGGTLDRGAVGDLTLWSVDDEGWHAVATVVGGGLVWAAEGAVRAR